MSTAGEEETLRKGFGDLRLLEFLKCEMKGEKHEKLEELITKLKDYIGDVEPIESSSDIFPDEKTTIIVACSKSDFEHASKINKDQEFIIIKANPLCQVVH